MQIGKSGTPTFNQIEQQFRSHTGKDAQEPIRYNGTKLYTHDPAKRHSFLPGATKDRAAKIKAGAHHIKAAINNHIGTNNVRPALFHEEKKGMNPADVIFRNLGLNDKVTPQDLSRIRAEIDGDDSIGLDKFV